MKIRTIGDYYKDNLRGRCHFVKNGGFINEDIFENLLELIDSKSTIVPVPSRYGGVERIAIDLARTLHTSVSFCLQRYSNDSIYQLKKDKNISQDDIKIRLCGNVPYGKITLFDNVIGTGVTIGKCLNLLEKDCDIVTIAIDWETFLRY